MRRRGRGAVPPGPPLLAPVQTLLIWRWPLHFLSRCRNRYGSRFTVNITSHPPLVFLCDPAETAEMLAGPAGVLHPGEGARTIEPLVGEESFMLMDGEEHLYGRRAVLPALRTSAVDDHAELVRELAGAEVAGWPLDVPFALHPRLRALTLQMLLRTIFTPELEPEKRMLRELHDRLLEMLTITASAVLPEPLLRYGPDRRIWRRFLRRRASADELIYSIIANRSGAARRPGDLLDRLLGARNPDGSLLSPRQVRDDLMSVILAGHETTASELAWAFQLLAHNPSVQERLTQQLDAGEGEAYLSATVKEVLRHRPVFLFAIPRAVKEPIEIGGWRYTPPAQVLACIYLVHHDPALYPEPEQFRPERFLDRSGQLPPAWLPWGAGRKRCPGLHLATLEMETVLRSALESFTIRPAAGAIERARWRSVIVTPHAGCRVVLHPRCRRKTSATRH
jgi:cytochrome P450